MAFLTGVGEHAELTAGDLAALDSFGFGVALNAAGTVLVVGAPSWEGSYDGQGCVYTYDLPADVWVQRGSTLTASDAAASDSFGRSVALSPSGNYLCVGAAKTSASASCIYFYTRSGDTWVADGSVLLPPALANNKIGWSVDISDDLTVLIVGAMQRNPTYTNQGAVFIYDKVSGSWVQRGSELVAGDAAASNYFGWSVSLATNKTVLAVGAPYATGTVSGQGKVYIYDWSGSAWVQRGSYLAAADAAADDRFGMSVALSGDAGTLLAVGAPYRDEDKGWVYYYSWSGSAWVQEQLLGASTPGVSDGFGSSVALSANAAMLAAGAPYRDVTSGSLQANAGTVYTFDNDAIITPPEPPAAVFGAPRPHLLTAYISGIEDSQTDYTLPLVSFGMTKRSADTSYYAISLQFSTAMMSALSARPNGLIYILRDGVPWESFNVGHPIRYDIGPRSASISINGTRQQTTDTPVTIDISADMVTTQGINSDGLLTLGLVPGFVDVRPADVITWDGADYTVTLIKFQAGASGQTINLTCELVP